MSPIKSVISVLFALGAAGALAQNGAQQGQPPTGKPVDDSATYGPVLNPQTPPATTQQPTTASTPQASGESRPQAQEERAGQPPPTGKQTEVDPSARPAPETTQPQTRPQPQTRQEQQGRPERQQQTRKDRQARRRPGAVQQIEGTPRIVAPAPALTPRAQAASAPAPVAPQTSQVIGCVGSTCTDVNGATYNAGGPGNTTVSGSGRLCTRNGANMQCL